METVPGSTRAKVTHAIERAQTNNVEDDGTFVWSDATQLQGKPRSPVDGNIDHIPPGEVEQVVLGVVIALSGAPLAALITETARTLGFTRTGSRIAEVLTAIIKRLLDDGQLSESFGMIRPLG